MAALLLLPMRVPMRVPSAARAMRKKRKKKKKQFAAFVWRFRSDTV